MLRIQDPNENHQMNHDTAERSGFKNRAASIQEQMQDHLYRLEREEAEEEEEEEEMMVWMLYWGDGRGGRGRCSDPLSSLR